MMQMGYSTPHARNLYIWSRSLSGGFADITGFGELRWGKRTIPVRKAEVNGNFARGSIIQSDMTLKPCWIAKVGGHFAHGKDIHEAHTDAIAKHQRNMPVEERLDSFIKEHPDMSEKYPGNDLFRWHNILTGSCEMGRRQFCKDRGIDPETDSFTVEEFIKLTCNSYGKDVIRQLADRLSVKL